MAVLLRQRFSQISIYMSSKELLKFFVIYISHLLYIASRTGLTNL